MFTRMVCRSACVGADFRAAVLSEREKSLDAEIKASKCPAQASQERTTQWTGAFAERRQLG